MEPPFKGLNSVIGSLACQCSTLFVCVSVVCVSGREGEGDRERESERERERGRGGGGRERGVTLFSFLTDKGAMSEGHPLLGSRSGMAADVWS